MNALGGSGRGRQKLPRPLLDRFVIGDDGNFPGAAVGAAAYLAAVERDVDALLNTRSPFGLDPGADEPGRRSVPGYGLPDFGHLSPDSPEDLWRLARMVAETLERFEPRLANIRAEPGERGSAEEGTLLVTADAAFGLGSLEFRLSIASLTGTDRDGR